LLNSLLLLHVFLLHLLRLLLVPLLHLLLLGRTGVLALHFLMLLVLLLLEFLPLLLLLRKHLLLLLLVLLIAVGVTCIRRGRALNLRKVIGMHRAGTVCTSRLVAATVSRRAIGPSSFFSRDDRPAAKFCGARSSRDGRFPLVGTGPKFGV